MSEYGQVGVCVTCKEPVFRKEYGFIWRYEGATYRACSDDCFLNWCAEDLFYSEGPFDEDGGI